MTCILFLVYLSKVPQYQDLKGAVLVCRNDLLVEEKHQHHIDHAYHRSLQKSREASEQL